MKKIIYLIFMFFSLFILLPVVKADSGLVITSELLTNSAKVGEEFKYKVSFDYPDLGYDTEIYIKFDSDEIEFVGIDKSTLRNGITVKYSAISDGYYKFNINDVKEEFDNIYIIINFRTLKESNNSKINLSVNLEERCKDDMIGDCSEFYLGKIEEVDAERSIVITAAEKDDNGINHSNNNNNDSGIDSSFSKTNTINYIFLGVNVVLIIVLIYLIVKKDKDTK